MVALFSRHESKQAAQNPSDPFVRLPPTTSPPALFPRFLRLFLQRRRKKRSEWKVKECEGGKLAPGGGRGEGGESGKNGQAPFRRWFSRGCDGWWRCSCVAVVLLGEEQPRWWWRRPIRGEFHLNCAQGAQPRLKGI